MLGKIVNAGIEIIIYSPVEKTSQSGLFSNKRLALLSLPQATIGYLSKIPEPLTNIQDTTIINKCKQKIKMKQIINFNIKIDDKNTSVLHLSWVDTKERKWEFKFENQQIVEEWIRYIQLSLQPPKPDPPKEQQANLNFSKIQSPKSRFSEYYFPKPKESPKNIQKTSANQYSYNNTSKDKSPKQQPKIVDQKKQTLQQSFTGRFRKFEQNNKTAQKQEDLPIITTFSQKFSNHNLFNTLGNNKTITPKETINWNLKWFEEIQTQPEEVYLHTYSLFVQFCKGKVTQIVKEITYPKRSRKFIPSKITNQEQVYYVQQVTFKLTVPFSINSDPVYLSTNQNLLKEYEQELQNNRLILKATRNKGAVKVPLACIVRYLGFIFYCEAIAPPNYKQIEQSMIYLFQKQLQKLQQKISLSLSQTKIRLFTNRPEGPPQRPNKSFFIIVNNLKYLTPRFKLKQNLYYYFPSQYYLYCEQIVKVGDESKRLKQIEQFSHQFLNSQESINCRIISSEDLSLSLRKHMCDISLIHWLSTQCKSKYLYSLFITEIIAEYFLLFVWISMSEFLKDQDEKQIQVTQFEDQISQIFADLVKPQGQSWQIVSDWLFATLEVIIKQQEIIFGYLFSSLSQKIGLQLDYQILRSQRPDFFSSRFVFSKKAIIKYFPAISKHQNRDISYNYDYIEQKVFQAIPLQQNLKQVIAFYSLQSANPNLQDYNMRALCRFLSFFIPIDQQKGFEHLKIYEGISLRFLDINVFQLFISAIKWLLLYQNEKQVLEIIAFFNKVCGFWVGQKNPFSITLQRLLGEYYSQKRNLEKAINYFNLSIENTQKLFSGGCNIENLDTDYKLAYIYLNSNKHKQALQKFKKVKKTIQKQNKQSLIILDLMVQIAKLYLHLGAIDKCLYYAKQTIKFAMLYPFKTQQQQFTVYQLILRSLQIQGDTQKMKFYIDLVQEKFAQTSNSWVLREVLKLTITQIVLSTTPYYLKKMAFFMYEIENRLSIDEVAKSETQKFKALRVYCGNAKYPQLLKKSIQICPQIVDQMVLIESQGKSYTNQQRELWINQAKILQLFCQFIGYEYILGQIVTKINQPDLN